MTESHEAEAQQGRAPGWFEIGLICMDVRMHEVRRTMRVVRTNLAIENTDFPSPAAWSETLASGKLRILAPQISHASGPTNLVWACRVPHTLLVQPSHDCPFANFHAPLMADVCRLVPRLFVYRGINCLQPGLLWSSELHRLNRRHMAALHCIFKLHLCETC